MIKAEVFPVEGGCDCRAVRYRMLAPPLIVHCCHCTSCQRETGTGFAINALIEAENAPVVGELEKELIPSESGRGQQIWRCASCKIALFSNYGGAKDIVRLPDLSHSRTESQQVPRHTRA